MIKNSTKEATKLNQFSVGVVSLMLGLSSIIQSMNGPGPWPGVDGLEELLIWFSIVAIISKVYSHEFPIAYSLQPLSGMTDRDTIICEWENSIGEVLEFFGDTEGCIKVREKYGSESQIPLKVPSVDE